MYALIHIYDQQCHSLKLFDGPDAKKTALKHAEIKIACTGNTGDEAKRLVGILDNAYFVRIDQWHSFILKIIVEEPVYCGYQPTGDTVETFFCKD